MDTQVVQEHHGDTSTCLRASHSAAQLRAERCGATAWCTLPIQPPVTPVNQAKAVLLFIIPRSFNQTLSTTALGTPHARQGWMQGNLHFVLQVDVGPWQ